MNFPSHFYLVLYIFLLSGGLVVAQNSEQAHVLSGRQMLLNHDSPFDDSHNQTKAVSTSNVIVNSYCKKLASTYSGYAIEIAFSEFPLGKEHSIFREFGNIYFTKLDGEGYSYLIKGEFSNKEAAINFTNSIIIPKISKAKLLQYKEGTRTIIN